MGLSHRGTFRAINLKRLHRRPRYELEDKVDQREVKLLIAREPETLVAAGPASPGQRIRDSFPGLFQASGFGRIHLLLRRLVASTARDIRNGHCRSQTETSAMVRGRF